ncbi:2-hydroxyhepta-2,4-diene-1,7-dioate isomerase, partial [Rubrivivax gelatinosus]|nr:2-hydroxyhepta-2,4-diene-1,7-dioate isomerase [Rubrivivax gelatinosus]
MKLLRHGPKGHERPAVLDAQGRPRDLSSILVDITPAALTPASLQRLRGLDLASLPEVEPARLAVPW